MQQHIGKEWGRVGGWGSVAVIWLLAVSSAVLPMRTLRVATCVVCTRCRDPSAVPPRKILRRDETSACKVWEFSYPHRTTLGSFQTSRAEFFGVNLGSLGVKNARLGVIWNPDSPRSFRFSAGHRSDTQILLAYMHVCILNQHFTSVDHTCTITQFRIWLIFTFTK